MVFGVGGAVHVILDPKLEAGRVDRVFVVVLKRFAVEGVSRGMG